MNWRKNIATSMAIYLLLVANGHAQEITLLCRISDPAGNWYRQRTPDIDPDIDLYVFLVDLRRKQIRQQSGNLKEAPIKVTKWEEAVINFEQQETEIVAGELVGYRETRVNRVTMNAMMQSVFKDGNGKILFGQNLEDARTKLGLPSKEAFLLDPIRHYTYRGKCEARLITKPEPTRPEKHSGKMM